MAILILTWPLLDRREAVPSMVLGRFSLIWKGMYMKIALFFYELFFTILLIIPGIVTMYAYAMVPYILEEKKDYTVGKAMKMSRKIMRGHKWELFCLRFSFPWMVYLKSFDLWTGIILCSAVHEYCGGRLL